MYKCEQCGKTSYPGDKAHKKVIDTRSRTYTQPITDKAGNVVDHRVIGHGSEIVKEATVCEACR